MSPRTLLLILSAPLIFASCASTEQSTLHTPEGKFRVVGSETGEMSWYSVKTNFGTATASGEKFSNDAETAAHKTLPLGSTVRVTNLNNGRSKILRINDRGPYKPGRIIDVAVDMSSPQYLAFHRQGVVPCKVEVLEKL